MKQQTWNDRLKECSRRSNQSVAQVSTITGVDTDRLSSIHHGQIEPSDAELVALAKAYGTTSAWLRAGKCEVTAWPRFRQSWWYKKTEVLSAGVTRRTQAVLTFLDQEYPGHLAKRDWAETFELAYPISSLNAGKRPAAGFVQMVAHVSGIALIWLLFGSRFSPTTDLSRITDQTSRLCLALLEPHNRRVPGAQLSKAEIRAIEEILDLVADQRMMDRLSRSIDEELGISSSEES